jgi:hypothetical protein
MTQQDPLASFGSAAFRPPATELDGGTPLRERELSRYRTYAIFGFYVAAAFVGFAHALSAKGGLVLAALAMASAATMGCIVDASTRGGYYPHSFRWITMVLWPIAVPIYVLRTRKWAGLAWIALGAGAFLVAQGIGSTGASVFR